jgi:hypothetical protein
MKCSALFVLLGGALAGLAGCGVDADRPCGLPCSVGRGACEARGIYVCVDDDTTCSAQAGAPRPEICNGVDDDCNGRVDDAIPEDPCVAGLGACAEGRTVCESGRASCRSLVSRAADDPCDFIDNDCDGRTDEDTPELGRPCTTGAGACEARGVWICGADGEPECSVGPGADRPELCNGLDDDCDGEVDNDVPSTSCVAGLGLCAQGATACRSGNVVCESVREPRDETCNELDDDCDGAVDIAVATGGLACRCQPVELLAPSYAPRPRPFHAAWSPGMCTDKPAAACSAPAGGGVATSFCFTCPEADSGTGGEGGAPGGRDSGAGGEGGRLRMRRRRGGAVLRLHDRVSRAAASRAPRVRRQRQRPRRVAGRLQRRGD